MLKYCCTAIVLKCFSSTPAMMGLYRRLGNRLGNKRRSSGTMPTYYAERVKRMLRLRREHNLVRNGDRILELGTGWLHWDALTLRLFLDIEAVLYDVWDNRQLGGMKNYLWQLVAMLDGGYGLSTVELKRVQSVAEAVMNVKSFDELYQLLGFKYVVESSGSLAQFPDNSFQLVVSGGVLEHVKRGALPLLIRETERLLKPGGWALHSINLSDHLSYYDGTVSEKMYLSFSESTWSHFFQNEVQYFNRVQCGEWLELFQTNGFQLIEKHARLVDISGLRLADRYRRMDKMDLGCTVLQLALKKSS